MLHTSSPVFLGLLLGIHNLNSFAMSSSDDGSDQKAQSPVDFNTPFKCRAEDLKEGEWLSGTVYYKVGKRVGTSHEVSDAFGRRLTVGNTILQDEMISAAQYDNEVRVTRSEMVEKLINAGDCTFTIQFRKQLTGKDVCDKLERDNFSTQPAAKKVKLCGQSIKLGEVRTLVGYVRNTEHVMGRSNVVDLGIPFSQHRERQVDHRTLESLILKRVKYILK